jgi:hypothetical protein
MAAAESGQARNRVAACPSEPNSVAAAMGSAMTAAQPCPGSTRLSLAIA